MVEATSRYSLFEEALRSRQLLEQAWNAETAYQGITLMPDDPISRGQCGVSSIWLARRLVSAGYKAQFAEGLLQIGNTEEACVWVHIIQPEQPALVVDITSDQFQSVHGTKVHVGEYEIGPGSIGAYTLQAIFDPYEVPRQKLLRRYEILQAQLKPTHFACAGLRRFFGISARLNPRSAR